MEIKNIEKDWLAEKYSHVKLNDVRRSTMARLEEEQRKELKGKRGASKP